ncbi:MAG: Na+/H+ antiporter subunit E [Acidimicrobiales bacterium]
MMSARVATRLGLYGALVAAWLALWQDISAANLLSGVALVGATALVRIGARPAPYVRPVALLRLLGLVLADLAVSTVQVARTIVRPGGVTDEAIIAVQVAEEHRHHWLLLVSAITLSPGTAVVDTNQASGTLYVHLLDHRRRGSTEATVHRLAALANAAFPPNVRKVTS